MLDTLVFINIDKSHEKVFANMRVDSLPCKCIQTRYKMQQMW